MKNSIIKQYDVSGASRDGLGSSISQMLKIPASKFNYLIYKYLNQYKCVVYDEILQESYQYLETDYPLHWTIASTHLAIAGYQCQKATTFFAGRDYEAWFTREIPVSDGPYKFSGLPGLIVKVNDTGNNYTFELTSLSNSPKTNIIAVPSKLAMTTTKRSFFQAARAARESVIDRASQYGITFKEPEAVRAQMREKLRRNNNPLEIIR